jgi:hypothetical protein
LALVEAQEQPEASLFFLPLLQLGAGQLVPTLMQQLQVGQAGVVELAVLAQLGLVGKEAQGGQEMLIRLMAVEVAVALVVLVEPLREA